MTSEFEPRKVIPFSEITYNFPRPPEVMRGTVSAMGLYFQGQVRDVEPIRGYLVGDTLDLLARTELGFARNIGAIDRMGLLPGQELEQILESAQPFFKDSEEESEAFGVALVSFAFLPELARHASLPQGFSRRGMLAPPVTTREFADRISELKTEVTKIISGETERGGLSAVKPRIMRTFLFFQVGSVIPLKMPQSPKESRERINELLRGIEGL